MNDIGLKILGDKLCISFPKTLSPQSRMTLFQNIRKELLNGNKNMEEGTRIKLLVLVKNASPVKLKQTPCYDASRNAPSSTERIKQKTLKVKKYEKSFDTKRKELLDGEFSMKNLKAFIFSAYWRPTLDAYENLLEILDDLYEKDVFLNVHNDEFLQKQVKFINKTVTRKIHSSKTKQKRDWKKLYNGLFGNSDSIFVYDKNTKKFIERKFKKNVNPYCYDNL